MAIKKHLPTYLILAIGAINFCIMLSLTWWQILRAYHKYELLHAKPQGLVHIEKVRTTNQLDNNQPVLFRLPIDKKYYFFIDPAIYQHQVGVELITTGYIKSIDQSIIIHLGWYPNRRSAEEMLASYDEKVGTKGLLYQPRGKLIQTRLSEQDWPRALTYLDTKTISSTLEKKTLPFVLITQGSALYQQLSSGHILQLGITRHICYALQFLMFGLIGIYYSKLLSSKKE